VLGVIIFLNQLFIVHRVVSKFGAIACYRASFVADIFLNIIFPEVIWLAVDDNASLWRKIIFWFVLILVLLLRQVSNGYSFLANFIVTNNSVSRKNYGKLNGMAQSLVALSRMFSPVVGGSLFAWSLSVKTFPIDHRLVFYVISGVSLLMLVVSLLLDSSLNKPKVEEKVDQVPVEKVVASTSEEAPIEE